MITCRNQKTSFTITALLACLLLPVSVSVWAQVASGRPALRPTEAPAEERLYGFLKSYPIARITTPGRIEIQFETVYPTPPAIVYYGINTLDEELDYPRFRASTREEGDFSELRMEHRVEFGFTDLPKKIPNTPIDSRITYRLAVYIPGMGERFHDGRVYFDPQTFGDTVNVLFGPVVDQVTQSTAIVSFETDRPAAGEVTVFRADAPFREEPVVESFTSEVATLHEISISGLRPGTVYTYSIRAGETRSREYQFRTQDNDGVFSFVAMVDSREGIGGGAINFGGTEARAINLLTSNAYFKGVDFILFPGDLVNGYVTSTADFGLQLDAFRRALEPIHARIPIYEAMGNHEALFDGWKLADGSMIRIDKEGSESAEAVFASRFVNPCNHPPDEMNGAPSYAENVYSFDWENARLFALNNNFWWSSSPHDHGGNLEGYILPEQIAWLREEVAKADADENIDFLFFSAQEPPYPNGGHTGDAMWYRGGDTNRDRQIDNRDIDIVGNRNEMWEIIAASPKSVAFITGDEHAYSRLMISDETNVGHYRKPDGSDAVFAHPVWQITSGGAGAPWYDKELDLPWSPQLRAHSTQPHCAMFRIKGGEVILEAYSQTGQLIDQATLRRDGRNLTE